MKIAFLASHGGSAARYLIGAARRGELDVEIGPLVTNNRESRIFEWCESNEVDVHHISSRTHPDEAERDLAISSVLSGSNSNFVVLSGYMKMIGPKMLESFENRILNVHPALLPKFGGKGMYGDRVHQAVLDSHETVSGATIHLVNAEYDEGPVLVQESVPIVSNETVDSLRQKVQALEGPLFLKAIRSLDANG